MEKDGDQTTRDREAKCDGIPHAIPLGAAPSDVHKGSGVKSEGSVATGDASTELVLATEKWWPDDGRHIMQTRRREYARR